MIRFILRSCRGMVILTVIMAVVSGACNAGLIAAVNAALTGPRPVPQKIVWAFIALGFAKVASLFISQATLAGFSQKAIAEVRRGLIRKVLAVPLRQLEEIGTPRILAVLTEDVLNVTQALLALPLITVNVAILLGGAVYLAWLSWQILAGICVVIGIGAVGYLFVVRSALHCCQQAREEEDKLFRHFRALTEGIKELKLHSRRRGAFYSDHIETATAAFQQQNVAAEMRFTAAQSWSHLLYFVLIGVILFLAPRLGLFDSRTLTGYTITALYLMGPLAGVLGSFPLFGRARAALAKIEELGLCLDERSTEACSLVESSERSAGFETLELRGVVHSYHREQEDSRFVLGPINLTFSAGELVFLVGGNGSGKSTLAKIITGLYLPEAGELRLNGEPVTDVNRDAYRQLFSAVFADFYLFDDLLGIHRKDLDVRAANYLKDLHLNHKVRVNNGSLSTTSVSQGQRKRLALLTAYLEDRPFYLFDEWASDQDPQFKNVFYTRLLPELKARGKTTLVITHDDKYFHVADRIVKLDYGQLTPADGLNVEPLLNSVVAAVGS